MNRKSLSIISCLFLFAVSCGASELSRTAPDIISQEVIPHLTKLDDIIANAKNAKFDKDDSGVVLLKERYQWVSKTGKVYRVLHDVYQAKTEQGVKALSKDSFSFDLLLTDIHLYKALTVLPDGTRKHLAPNAAFLQRGRSNSSSQTYHSDSELIVIYPDIKVGSITQSIVIYEDKKPRIQDNYSDWFSWRASWPIQKIITTIDLDGELFKKLKTKDIGPQKHPYKQLSSKKGRVKIQWLKHQLSSRSYETNRESSLQVGPATQLTTLQNWDAVAEWYNGLVAPQSNLSAALKAKADEWTKGLTTQQEIVNTLFRHVANDVRYTGLEFGNSGLQPYDCNDVWRNQYGDCKDKSNLLCALLRHKGIQAYITLINTNGKGVVHKETPDYKAFNHAITAVRSDENKGEWILCDPTISYGKPGMLAPSSANRNALIVMGKKAEWVKTPASSAGSLNYDFDLALNGQGLLSGWMTLTSTGYYSISTGRSYAGLDRESTLRKLNNTIQPFYAGAAVADYILPIGKDKQFSDPIIVKAFFTCPSIQPDQKGNIHLVFPKSGGLMVNYGTNKSRLTDYFQWKDSIQVKSSILLPKGWGINSTPTPIKATTPFYSANAYWEHQAETRKSVSYLKLTTPTDVVPAKNISEVQQVNVALESWFQQDLTISKNSKPQTASSPTAEAPDTVEMSLMPTGDGQLELLDRLYPINGSSDLRKKALKRVIPLFPNDHNTVFATHSKLAHLEYYNEAYLKAVDLYDKLLSKPVIGIDQHAVSYAHYMRAVSVRESGDVAKAVDLLKVLSKFPQLSDYRRGWTLAILGDYITELPGEAVDGDAIHHYKEALKIESEHSSYAMVGLFTYYCKMKKTAEASALLSNWLKAHADQSTETLKDLSEKLTVSKDSHVLSGACEAISQCDIFKDPQDELYNLVAKTHSSLQKTSYSRTSNKTIRKKLIALLTKHESTYLTPSSGIENADTRVKVEAHLDEIYLKNRLDWLNSTTYYFKTYEADGGFTERVWKFLSFIKAIEQDMSFKDGEGLFRPLAEICKEIPHTDGNYWECQFTMASWHEHKQHWDKAVSIYDAMHRDPDLDKDFNHSAWHRMGNTLERTGQWKRAIKYHTHFKDERADSQQVCEHLIRAGIIHLRLGNPALALKTWELLLDVPDSTWKSSSEANEIKSALIMVKEPKAAIAYWKQTATWWNDVFLVDCQKMGMSSPPKIIPLYMTNTATEIETAIKEATDAEDLPQLLQSVLPVADSCRWFPSYIAHFKDLLYQPSSGASPENKKISLMMIAKLAATVKIGDPEEIANAQRIEVAMLFDSGEHKKANEKSEIYIKDADKYSYEHQERLTWLYMYSARKAGEDMKNAISQGFAHWETGVKHMDYYQFAHALALILNADKQVRECKVFIKEATTKKTPDNTYYKALIAMLENFNNSSVAKDDFNKGFSQWLDKNKPIWYDHISPKSLEDKRLSDIDKVINNNVSKLHTLERIKALCLIANSEDLPLLKRELAYVKIVEGVAGYTDTWQEYVDLIISSIEMDLFSEQINRSLVWGSYVELCYRGQTKLIDRLTSHPAYQLVAESHREGLGEDLRKTCIVTESLDPQAIKDLIRTIAKRELSSLDLSSILRLTRLLGLAGDIDGLSKISKEVKSWKFADDANPGQLQVRLQVIKMVKIANRRISASKLCLKTTMDIIREKAKSAPGNWTDYRNPTDHLGFSSDQKESIKAAQVQNKSSYDPTDLSFWYWGNDFWASDNGKNNVDRMAKMLSIALESDMLDEVKTACASSILAYATDHAETSQVIFDAFNSWMKKQQATDAMKSLQLLCKQAIFYNTNKNISAKVILESRVKGSFIGFLSQRISLNLMLHENKTKEIEAFLAQADSQQLMEPILLEAYLEALSVTGSDDEFDLIAEHAEEQIEQKILDCWEAPSGSEFLSACQLAILIDKRELLSVEWMDYVIKSLNKEDRRAAEVIRAVVLKKWQQVIQLSTKEIENTRGSDRNYHMKYYQGLALHHLGKKKEARLILTELAKVNPSTSEFSYMAKQQLRSLK